MEIPTNFVEKSLLLESLYFPSNQLDGGFVLNENLMEHLFLEDQLGHFQKFAHLFNPQAPGVLTAAAENLRLETFKTENPEVFDSEGFCYRLCMKGRIPFIFKDGLKQLFYGQLKIYAKTFTDSPKTSINGITCQYSPGDLEPLGSLSGRFSGHTQEMIVNETSLIIAKKTFAIILETPNYFANMDYTFMGHPNIGPPSSIANLANQKVLLNGEFLVYIKELEGFTVSSRTLFNAWLHYIDPVKINDLATFINEFCLYIG
jgi:hypothetical protein